MPTYDYNPNPVPLTEEEYAAMLAEYEARNAPYVPPPIVEQGSGAPAPVDPAPAASTVVPSEVYGGPADVGAVSPAAQDINKVTTYYPGTEKAPTYDLTYSMGSDAYGGPADMSQVSQAAQDPNKVVTSYPSTGIAPTYSYVETPIKSTIESTVLPEGPLATMGFGGPQTTSTVLSDMEVQRQASMAPYRHDGPANVPIVRGEAVPDRAVPRMAYGEAPLPGSYLPDGTVFERPPTPTVLERSPTPTVRSEKRTFGKRARGSRRERLEGLFGGGA